MSVRSLRFKSAGWFLSALARRFSTSIRSRSAALVLVQNTVLMSPKLNRVFFMWLPFISIIDCVMVFCLTVPLDLQVGNIVLRINIGL